MGVTHTGAVIGANISHPPCRLTALRPSSARYVRAFPPGTGQAGTQGQLNGNARSGAKEHQTCIDMQASAATSVGLQHSGRSCPSARLHVERSQPHPDRQVHRAWRGDLLASG